ncbi:AI-2E family transporter [Paludisphaera borealis]|uniref:AI-2 transport protein TqsA n=1 Tax=Paludisphaera borealis TaxID=1387353 RepID=A0A1U7CXH2_9BACT|nr:AI-2E family transporter [Paludisphaera borealis]APW63598.1 AI-2 transport protein TqsA [Paludisphaera borealis]
MENHATAAADPGAADDDLGSILDAAAPKPGETAGAALLQRAPSLSGVRMLAFVLVIIATSLYLLERLEPVLRPLLIAVLLCYLFLPLYNRLRRKMWPVLSFLSIAIGFTLGILLLTRMVYRDVVEIDAKLPIYQQREAELESRFRELSNSFTSRFQRSNPDAKAVEPEDSLTSELSQRLVRGAASAFVSISLESVVIAFYMIFLLQSASRLPQRITASFSTGRAQGIMEVVESINHAISEYLAVKVKASLLVAVPIGLLCWGFGITGAATWAVITFFGNFLPYIGPLIAVVPPVTLAFLEFDSMWPPIVFTLILITINGVTSNVIEPAMTGKALGLSPLIVLIGLAFWSLLWGLVGMVLAVPLTVIFKIILEHTPATRPIARLISDEE